MRLLIVEDNARMRHLIRSVVANLAEDVYECSDGSEALGAYSEHLPDWVLMDIVLPNLDGIAATKQIKTVFPQAQIVMVTEYDDVKIREAAQTAGVCGYVLKENLLEVRRILEAPNRNNDQEPE
jgi:CheY-like chemotaxis protein